MHVYLFVRTPLHWLLLLFIICSVFAFYGDIWTLFVCIDNNNAPNKHNRECEKSYLGNISMSDKKVNNVDLISIGRAIGRNGNCRKLFKCERDSV